MESPRITEHAIERYIGRVDATATREQARISVAQIVTRGRVRSTPRHWMRSTSATTPGLRYVYCCEQADVCALVLDGAVITILTHQLCRPLQVTVVNETGTRCAGRTVYHLCSSRRSRGDYREAA